MKALGLEASEKNVDYVFSHCKSMGVNDPRGGVILPQVHVSQDLCKAPHNNTAYKIKKLWLLWFQRRRLMHVFSIIRH